MALLFSSGPRSSRPMKPCFCRWPSPAPLTSRPWPQSVLVSAPFEEDPRMAPERTTRINRPEEEPEHQHPDTGPEGTSEIEEPRSTGFGARLRQLVAQSREGASHPNIQRQQLKQDRTKSSLMLAGSMVVMALMFFAMFSSPSSNRRINSAHPNTPNLGRGPGAKRLRTTTIR